MVSNMSGNAGPTRDMTVLFCDTLMPADFKDASSRQDDFARDNVAPEVVLAKRRTSESTAEPPGFRCASKSIITLIPRSHLACAKHHLERVFA